MPEQDSTAKPPAQPQRSGRMTLPDGNNYVSVMTHYKELWATYYPDDNSIVVRMGVGTSLAFTPAQWSTVFAAVASVSPRRNVVPA